jgi:hypothetical protein
MVVVSQDAERPPWFTGGWVTLTRPQTIGDMVDATVHDGITVIANADIEFNKRSVELISHNVRDGEAWCITRCENGKLWNVDYSQDAWAFRGGLLFDFDRDIRMGVPGFDNVLAYEFKRVGYEVLNPSLDVRIEHVHSSRLITPHIDQCNRLPLPYMFVKPHKIGGQPRYRMADKLPASVWRPGS